MNSFRADVKECRNVEKCVLCGQDTEYTFDVPIQKRRYYIVGCGQLCEKCSWAIENDSKTNTPKLI